MRAWNFIKANPKLIGSIFTIISAVAVGSPKVIKGVNNWIIERHDSRIAETAFKSRVLNYIEADSSIKMRILNNHITDSMMAVRDRAEMTVVKANITGYWKAKKEFETVTNFQQDLLNALNEVKKNN